MLGVLWCVWCAVIMCDGYCVLLLGVWWVRGWCFSLLSPNPTMLRRVTAGADRAGPGRGRVLGVRRQAGASAAKSRPRPRSF